MKSSVSFERRWVVKALVASPLLALAGGCSEAGRTPSQIEGPFYPLPAMRPSDQDNDLVRIAPAVQEAGGEIMRLSGQVRERDGRAAVGARVEIWQVDMNGRYIHTGHDDLDRPRDPAFQGFGHAITDAKGAYAFRTIKPVHYAGRTPHIHVKVFTQGIERLTTQFYLDGHPENKDDLQWWWLSEAEREAVAMRFKPSPDGLPATTVNILL